MNYIQSFNKLINCNENTTYIMGYWNVRNNKKNSYESHYKPLILKTLNIIKDQNIVFFYEDEDVINSIKKNVKNNIIFIKKELMDLPTYKISKDYLETCKQQNTKELSDKFINWDKGLFEKGFVHYHREYKQSGENVFRQLFTIWTSKIFLVQEIIRLNPFHNNYFAWMDISCARFNRKEGLYTQFYLPNQLFYFNNPMKYYGITLPINASFLMAHRNIWKKLIPLYEKQLQLSKDSKYAHDEETLLYLIWKDNKNLFCDIKNIKKKILFIGYNKTATSTIDYLFKINHFNTQHYSTNFYNSLKKYDVVSDTGDGININKIVCYETISKKYPNAIFILNTRNLKKWIKSRAIHYYRRGVHNFSIYGYPITLQIIIKWIEERNIYYNNLVNYFKFKSRLILLNIDDLDWQNFISKQFNLEIKEVHPINITQNDGDLYTKTFTKFNNKKCIVPYNYLKKIDSLINKAFNIKHLTDDLNILNIHNFKNFFKNNF